MLSCLSPTLVCAEQPHGFIDYRHEYLDDTRTHADRVEFGTFFSNGIGLMGELRYNTDEGDKDKWDPSQFGNNGTGLSVVYRFKPLDDKKFWLEPMFWLDTTQYWSTYEYGLSAGYDFSSRKGKQMWDVIITAIAIVGFWAIVIAVGAATGWIIERKKPAFYKRLWK